MEERRILLNADDLSILKAATKGSVFFCNSGEEKTYVALHFTPLGVVLREEKDNSTRFVFHTYNKGDPNVGISTQWMRNKDLPLISYYELADDILKRHSKPLGSALSGMLSESTLDGWLEFPRKHAYVPSRDLSDSLSMVRLSKEQTLDDVVLNFLKSASEDILRRTLPKLLPEGESLNPTYLNQIAILATERPKSIAIQKHAWSVWDEYVKHHTGILKGISMEIHAERLLECLRSNQERSIVTDKSVLQYKRLKDFLTLSSMKRRASNQLKLLEEEIKKRRAEVKKRELDVKKIEQKIKERNMLLKRKSKEITTVETKKKKTKKSSSKCCQICHRKRGECNYRGKPGHLPVLQPSTK